MLSTGKTVSSLIVATSEFEQLNEVKVTSTMYSPDPWLIIVLVFPPSALETSFPVTTVFPTYHWKVYPSSSSSSTPGLAESVTYALKEPFEPTQLVRSLTVSIVISGKRGWSLTVSVAGRLTHSVRLLTITTV